MLTVSVDEHGEKLAPKTPLFIDRHAITRLRITVEPHEFMDLARFCQAHQLTITPAHSPEDKKTYPLKVLGTEICTDVQIETLLSGLHIVRFSNVDKTVLTMSTQYKSFYLTVNPPLNTEGISMCTVYTHALGPLAEWPAHVQKITEMGANMIHFTPINTFGTSKSCYSLASWSAWHRNVGSAKALGSFIRENLLSKGAHAMYDIVLNHVSPGAYLIRSDKTLCFNTSTYPYLQPAAVMDMHFRVIEASILRTGWDKYPKKYLLTERDHQVLNLDFLRSCYWDARNAGGGVGINHDRASEFCHALTMLVGRVFDDLRLFEYDKLDESRCYQAFTEHVEFLNPDEFSRLINFFYNTVIPQYEDYTMMTGPRSGALIRFGKIWRDIRFESGLTVSNTYQNAADGSLSASLVCSLTSSICTSRAETKHDPDGDYDGSVSLKDLGSSLEKTIQLRNAAAGMENTLSPPLCVKTAEIFHDILAAFDAQAKARHAEDRAAILSAVGGGIWYRLFVNVDPAFNAFCYQEKPRFDVFLNGFQPLIDDEDPKREPEAILSLLEKEPHQHLPRVENGEIVCAACNGWVMGQAYDFTTRASRAYLRCNVITWGDCIRLAYFHPDGTRNIKTWRAAQLYVQQCASIFDAIRIDNAHSTDRRVLRHVINAARRARPEIYVMLECFLGDGAKEANLLQEVGANSLVYELINVTSIGELCATVVFGGETIGRVRDDVITRVPALMFDVTHDNTPPSGPFSFHNEENLVVLSAITCSNCLGGMGTTYLVGQGFGRKIEVTDKHTYEEHLQHLKETDAGRYNALSVIADVKKKLGQLHCQLIQEGYTQVYAHNHGEIITVERMHPATGDSIVFVLRPSFRYNNSSGCMGDKYMNFQGSFADCLLNYNSRTKTLSSDPAFSVGSEATSFYTRYTDETFPPGSISIFTKTAGSEYGEIMALSAAEPELAKFHKIFETLPIFHQKWFLGQVPEEENADIQQNAYLFANDRGMLLPSYSGFDGLRDALFVSDVSGPLAENMRQGDWLMEYIPQRNMKYFKLYCAEETPEVRKDVETMLQIFHKYVGMVKRVPSSLRARCMHHIFAVFDSAIVRAILTREKVVAAVPTAAADFEYTNLHKAFCSMYRATYALIGFSPACANIDLYYARMLLTLLGQSNEFRGVSVLDTLRETLYNDNIQENHVSLAAGYPHFFQGMFRSWGRDVALAITGCMTIFPSRQMLARQIILTSFSLVRHGMLPNLQDSGRRPRYNARDAVWFMLSALCDYLAYTKDESILEQPIVRFYPTDAQADYVMIDNFYVLGDLARNSDSSVIARYIMPLKQVVLEVVKYHLMGIHFREWNAGQEIDEHMRYEGFDIDVVVDEETGLIFGGNEHNCGTWMDKMGSADWLNRGCPATSRHGANVEINMCCLNVLNMIMERPNVFTSVAMDRVTVGCAVPSNLQGSAGSAGSSTGTALITAYAHQNTDAGLSMEKLSQWHNKLKTTILENPILSRIEHKPSKSRILRDTVTPDLLKAYKKMKEMQGTQVLKRVDDQNSYFRPNYFIGLSFHKGDESFVHAFIDEIDDGLHGLHTTCDESRFIIRSRHELKAKAYCPKEKPVSKNLIGMRTLHHLDAPYRVYYDQSDYSSRETAAGFNYHNGPAWGHVYARAILAALLAGYAQPAQLFVNLTSFLDNHSNVNMSFKSIPELQQADGSFCHGSTTSQAWALGGFLEALHVFFKM